MGKAHVLACIVLVCMVVGAPGAEAAVSCNQVLMYLSPCLSYVSQGGSIPSNCCNGIRTLYGLAQSRPDRQGVCRCLKNAASGISYSQRNLNLAAGLPAKCGVNLPYQISPNTNCDTLN